MTAQSVAVLDTAAVRGRGGWVRVVAADGAAGWVPVGALRGVRPGTWTTSLARGRRVSPDADTGEYDPPVVSDSFPDTTLVEPGVLSGLRGAARRTRLRRFPPLLPAVLEDIPWVLARGERRDAWFPVDQLLVRCGGSTPEGMVRAPFLAPRSSVPPLEGASLLSWNVWTDSVTPEGGADRAPGLGQHLWRIVPPAGSRAGFAAIDGYAGTGPAWEPEACVANGGWAAGQVECAAATEGWVLRGNDGGIRLLVPIASEVPEPVRAEFVDLDGDGRSEMVLEVSTRYGDGTIDHLWVVDGRDGGISALGIGGNSGEPSAPEPVFASWRVVDSPRGRRLAIRTRQGSVTESVTWAWRSGRFRLVGR